MATGYVKTALTGGGTALDGVDGSILSADDIAIVLVGNTNYIYKLDAGSSASENSPDVITPDTNPGTKRWILQTDKSINREVAAKGDLLVATASSTLTNLGVGTDTYVLVADSSEDSGMKWAPQDSLESTINAKGDLLIGTANDNADRLPVGTDNQVLVVDSSESTGVKWDTLAADISGNFTQDSSVLVGTGSGTYQEETGATLRTSLGLTIGTDVLAPDGSGANLTGVGKTDTATEYTKTQNFNATTLTDASSIAWDVSSNQVSSVTLSGNRALANPTNLVDGATYILIVKQDATGSRTLSYGTAYKWPGGTAPTLTTTASAVDILTFVSDGTNMYGVSTLDFS